MSYITILHDVNGDHAGKTFYSDGKPKTAPIKDYWFVKQAPVYDFQSMSKILRFIMGSEPASYIIRGQPLPKTIKRLKDKVPVRRLMNDKTRDGSIIAEKTFSDEPVNYVCIDSDRLDYPDHLSKDEAIKWLINQLPEPFHQASCLYQYSSSAFYKKDDDTGKYKLKVHLWFWIDQPITAAQLREYVKREIKQAGLNPNVIDQSVLKATQPLYTAPPMFIGIAEPLAIDERIGIIQGENDSVKLPKAAYADHKQQQKIARRKKPQRPQQAYCGDETGFADKDCYRRVHKQLEQYRLISSDRYLQTLKTATYLGGFVGAGRLLESLAKNLLIEAAGLNGCIDKHGAKATSQIEQGLANGVLSPIYKTDNLSPKLAANSKNQAISRHLTPSTISEINEATHEAVKSGVEQAATDKVIIIKIPTGAGKSYQALKVLSEINSKGKTVVFTAPTYDALNEARERLKGLAAHINPLVIKGQKRRCKSYMQSNAEQRAGLDEILEDRRITDLCHSINEGRQCPFFSQCELRQKAQREPLEGRFILAVHQMIGHLKELPDDTLLVIDESPNFVEKTTVELRAITALIARNDELNKWANISANDNSSEPAAPKQLDLFESTKPPRMRQLKLNFNAINHKTPSEEWRYKHKDTISPFCSAIKWVLEALSKAQPDSSIMLTQELIKKLTKDRFTELSSKAKKALDEIELGNATPALFKVRDMLTQANLELDSYKSVLVKRSAVSMIKRLAELCLNDDEQLWLAPNEKGLLSVSKRYDLKLPDVPIVVLDATAQIKSWGKVSKRDVEVINANITVKQRDGYHLKTRALQSPELWANKSKTELNAQVYYRLNRITDYLSEALSSIEIGSSIGIGASKPLRALIEQGLDGKGQLAETKFIKLLSQYQCTIGHTGQDHAYTNRFSNAGVKAMLILGGQYPHFGEQKADCKHLGANPDEISNMLLERNESNMVQWHGRPRSLRRSTEEIIHIEISPSPTPLSWINWGESKKLCGKAQTDELKDAINIAKGIISAKGCLRVAELTDKGVDSKRAYRAIKALNLIGEDDHTHSKRGKPPKIYRPPSAEPQVTVNKKVYNSPQSQKANNSKSSHSKGVSKDEALLLRKKKTHIYQKVNNSPQSISRLTTNPPSRMRLYTNIYVGTAGNCKATTKTSFFDENTESRIIANESSKHIGCSYGGALL